MSFLKRLFGGGSESSKSEPASEPIEHDGFLIQATPFTEGGQYQTCGVITKEVGGVVREHKFIRADRFASHADAVEVTIRKARQLIDQQGERIFN